MSEAERELLRALALMRYQYIGAGEESVEQLVKFGLLEPEARGGRWTPAAHVLMD